MSRVYVFLADGFEEIEGLTVVDILRRAGVDTTTVSIMEEVANMAYRCEHLKKDIEEAPQVLQDKHFFRKHGENAYYGNDL